MIEKPAIEGGRPVRDEFLVYGRPSIGEEEVKEVVDAIRSGWLGLGPRTREFESRFAEYMGVKHAVGLNSCTAGLFLSLKVLRLCPGEEVITSPMTFAATANVIEHHGAKPVFVDIDRNTLNMDTDRLEGAVGKRTRGIIAVHMAGRPCDMTPILDLAKRRRLFVVNDSAHAIETRYGNRTVGSLGDMSSFSFYATKTLATGEGGMLTTNTDEWAERIRILRLHGISSDAWKRYASDVEPIYETVEPGYKLNMWDVQAAMGIHQLKRLEPSLARRRDLFLQYDSGLKELDQVAVLDTADDGETRHARCIYIVLLKPEALRIDRAGFMSALRAENIGTGIHFRALHTHKYYRERYGYAPGDFPEADFVSERTLSLPLSAAMTDEDAGQVIEAVRKIARYYAR